MTQRKPSLSDLARSLERMGVHSLYLTEAAHRAIQEGDSPQVPSAQTARSAAPASAVPQPYVTQYRRPDPQVVSEKQSRLAQLEEPLRACRECKLHSGRTNLVFGVGNPDADLMFIGEGPGHDEDLQGEPFVGRAGRLLTDMIQKGMRLEREGVYIANIVKCRPPDNRNPEPEEMSACVPNLLKQVEIIAPKVIVTLGAIPARAFLGSKTGITRLRGNWMNYQGIPVMPTLHPAYLLRNPPAKKDCWEDLKQVIAVLNGECVPPPGQAASPALF